MKIQRLFNLPKWFRKIGSHVPILREQIILWNYSHMVLSFHLNQELGGMLMWKDPETDSIHWYHLDREGANRFFRGKMGPVIGVKES